MSAVRARLPDARPSPALSPTAPPYAPSRPAPAPVFSPVEAPPWSHRLLPRPVRLAMSGTGLWADPVPQPPSRHLAQTDVVLQRYGWCQTTDAAWTGRLCIRGAQDLLERTGHVTAADRALAVGYMQQALAAAGVRMAFFTWNDLPGTDFGTVRHLLRSAAARAHKKGD